MTGMRSVGHFMTVQILGLIMGKNLGSYLVSILGHSMSRL